MKKESTSGSSPLGILDWSTPLWEQLAPVLKGGPNPGTSHDELRTIRANVPEMTTFLLNGLFPADNVITATKNHAVHKIHMSEPAAWVLNATHWFSDSSGRHFSHRVASSETAPKLSFSKTKVQTKPHNKVQVFWSIFRTKCKPQTKVQAKIRPTLERAPWRPFWELPSISQPLSPTSTKGPGAHRRGLREEVDSGLHSGPGAAIAINSGLRPDHSAMAIAQERESFCHCATQEVTY